MRGLVVCGCPLIGLQLSYGCLHALAVGFPLLPLPVLVCWCFLESASFSGGPSKRAVQPDMVGPSGSPPSELQLFLLTMCLWLGACVGGAAACMASVSALAIVVYLATASSGSFVRRTTSISVISDV